MTSRDTLNQICTAAVATERATGMPAEVTVAQCALESAWLKFSVGNNAFGVKQYSESQPGQLLRTREWFKSDASAKEWAAKRAGRELIEATGATKNGLVEYKVRDWFRAYASLEECFSDHARLITKGAPYRKAWAEYQQGKDWRKLIYGIAAAGYATAPNYAESLLRVLDNGVLMAIHEARNS